MYLDFNLLCVGFKTKKKYLNKFLKRFNIVLPGVNNCYDISVINNGWGKNFAQKSVLNSMIG